MNSPTTFRKPRKNEIVAGKIREYIVDNELRPGDRLPTEDEFAERFEVSRVSVREATRGLSLLGVIDSAPRRGLTVGQVDIERVSHYIGFHLAMGDYALDDLIDTRVIIETGGLRHVARRMREDRSIYDGLNSLNSRLETASEMVDWVAIDREFHASLVAATGLETLTAFDKLIHLFFAKFRDNFPRSEWPSGVADHQRVLDQLRDGDWENATSKLTEHIESHRDRGTRPQAT